MIGIPFTIRRFSENGVEDEQVFLRSRRRGPEGEAMRRHLLAFKSCSYERMKAMSAAIAVARKIDEVTGPEFEAMHRQYTELTQRAADLEAQMLTHSEAVADLALRDNYGADTDRIVDLLNDRELSGIVTTLENGMMPKDFFPLPDTQPSPSSIGPSGAATPEPCSPAGGQSPTSSPG